MMQADSRVLATVVTDGVQAGPESIRRHPLMFDAATVARELGTGAMY